MRETYLHDCHIYQDDDLEIMLDRLHEGKSGLAGEIEIRSGRPPYPGLVYHGNISLTSGRSRASVVIACKQRVTTGWHDDTDFASLIEAVAYRSIQRWREGDPPIDLLSVDISERPRWLLEPFIEFGGPTVLFGYGGSGKSLTALALALSGAGADLLGDLRSTAAPVLYLDWETDQYVHAIRLRSMLDGCEPQKIYYRRQTASLAEAAPLIRKEIGALGIGLVIVDSLGAARGGDPDSAEVTLKMFSAGRTFGVPWLAIDHLAKHAKDRSMPFGSVYTVNMARLAWRLDSVQREGESESTVVLTNTKSNNGQLSKRRAYRVHFGEKYSFTPIDAIAVPGLDGRTSQADAIAQLLRANGTAMKVRDMAMALEVDGLTLSENALRAVLSRRTDRFVRVAGDRDGGMWGIKDTFHE